MGRVTHFEIHVEDPEGPLNSTRRCILQGVANGGVNVVPKMPVPGAGWLSYFKDTEDNIFGVMQPAPSAS